MIRFLALAVVALLTTAATADIEVNPQYEANEKITIKVVPTGVPAGALLRGSFQVSDAQVEMVTAPNVAELRTASVNLRAAAAKLLELAATLVAPEQAEQKKLLEEQAKAVTDSATEVERALASESYNVWAGTGTHEVTASGIWVLTDTGTLGGKLLDFGMYNYSKKFTVGKEDDVPVPPPIPVPTPGKRSGVVLIESNSQQPDQGARWVELRTKFKTDRLLVADVTQLTDKQKQNLLNSKVYQAYQANGGQLPALIVQADGAAIRALPCPSTAAEIDKEVDR